MEANLEYLSTTEQVEDISSTREASPFHKCPRCNSKFISYCITVKHSWMWVCHSCGLGFSVELAIIFSEIEELDLIDSYASQAASYID